MQCRQWFQTETHTKAKELNPWICCALGNIFPSLFCKWINEQQAGNCKFVHDFNLYLWMCNCVALTLVTSSLQCRFVTQLQFPETVFLSHLHQRYVFLLRIYPTFVYLAPLCLTLIIVIFVCCSSLRPFVTLLSHHNQRGTCLLYICQPFAASTRSLSPLKSCARF